jgi:hypothetical protein
MESQIGVYRDNDRSRSLAAAVNPKSYCLKRSTAATQDRTGCGRLQTQARRQTSRADSRLLVECEDMELIAGSGTEAESRRNHQHPRTEDCAD